MTYLILVDNIKIEYLFFWKCKHHKPHAVGHTVGAVAGRDRLPADIAADGAYTKAGVSNLLREKLLQKKNLLCVAGVAPGEHTGNIAVVVLQSLLNSGRKEGGVGVVFVAQGVGDVVGVVGEMCWQGGG